MKRHHVPPVRVPEPRPKTSTGNRPVRIRVTGLVGCATILSLLLPATLDAEVRRIPPGEDHEEHLADPALWELVWADEFEGDGIDTAKWHRVDSGGGFGNNELQYYTPRPTNAFVSEGSLVIQALKEDFRGMPTHRQNSTPAGGRRGPTADSRSGRSCPADRAFGRPSG